MDWMKDWMKTPMVKLLETIQQEVMHKLPYYNDFKLSYQGEKGTLEKYLAELKPITEDQKKGISELIKTNKLLFGYRNDIKSIGVLTNIIEYSTFCGDPVAMAKRKLGITGYNFFPFKSKIEKMRDKIIQIMHYFYYHPDITREIGAALEKNVDVPIRHRMDTEKFDYNYSQGDSIIFEKNGIRTVGTIKEKDKQQYQVDYIDYKDKSKITTVTLGENDILGYGDNKGGIISWIFTDVVIDDFTEACLDPKYDGKNRESKKCEQGEPLNMRNNVICTLYEGAKTANPNTQYPEIKICTECKEEDNMSGVTDQESRESSISSRPSTSSRDSEFGHRGVVYGRPPSLSSLSSYGESADTNMTTLTDEESQAYDTFKKAVCKASLEEKEAKLKTKEAEISKNKAESDKALAEKQKKIDDLEKKVGKINLGFRSGLNKLMGKKGGKKKSSTKKKRKNATRRKKKYGKKSKKSRK